MNRGSRRTVSRPAAGLVLAIAALAASRVAPAADTVVLAGGQRYPGKVVRDDLRGVRMSVEGVPGSALEWRREDVSEVIYDGGKPEEYRLGKRAFDSGNYRNALIYLEAALDGPHHRLLEQYVLVHVARSLERLGRKDEAVTSYERLREKGAATRFLPEATERLVRICVDRAKLDGIAGGIGKLLPEGRALLVRGLVEEKHGRFRSALDIYRRAMRVAGRGSGTAAEARLGSGRCLIGLGRHDEAAREAECVTASTRSPEAGEETLAEAYVVLGDALAARASAGEGYEEALLAYLRVPTLYPGREETEARALRGAAFCYKRIPGRESAARAERLTAMLREKYPESARTAARGGKAGE